MRSRRNRVGGEIMEDQDLIGHQLGLMGRNGKDGDGGNACDGIEWRERCVEWGGRKLERVR